MFAEEDKDPLRLLESGQGRVEDDIFGESKLDIFSERLIGSYFIPEKEKSPEKDLLRKEFL